MTLGPVALHSSEAELLRYTNDGFNLSAFVAQPHELEGPYPAIVVLHEWWGLNPQIKATARRLSREGYYAVVPDLYARQGSKVTSNPTDAAALMNGLSSQAALRDLNALTRVLKARSFIDAPRIGILGFSMGATLALTQAAHNSDLKAAVCFYGKVPPIETLNYLLCPVQYHHAGKDAWVTRQEAERVQQGLEKYGKPGEVHRYPSADHSFFNETRPEVYSVQDAQRAWRLSLAFFKRHLV